MNQLITDDVWINQIDFDTEAEAHDVQFGVESHK